MAETTGQITWQQRGQWLARLLGMQPADLATFCDGRIRAGQAAAASPAASPAAAANGAKRRGRKPKLAMSNA